MSDRPYDLVLLGATGFTGSSTAAHLAGRTKGRPWAIAGRDAARLATIAEQLAVYGDVPEVVVVDVTDELALQALTSSTRVLATTVGPFARLGMPVARACVATGTDYADITGEPAFVDQLLRDLDTPARAAGVRLVTCCGFDSVPHDLAVHHAVQVLPDDEPVVARGYVQVDAAFSGGTAASALDAAVDLRRPDRPRRRVVGEGRRVRGMRPRVGRSDDPRGVALPMPTIDPEVVLRSAALLPSYGPDFRYAHHLVVAGPLQAAVLGGAAGLAAALSRLPGGRGALDRLVPARGEGPAPGRRARSSFRTTVHARAAGGARARAVVSGGDPGYDETARMLGETALGLLDDEVGELTGVVTPAVALGDALRARLVSQGQVHEVELHR